MGNSSQFTSSAAPKTTSARDYLVDIIGLDDAEVEALIEAGESPDFIAQSAGMLFSEYAKKGVQLDLEDVRNKIREQYPEAFNFKIVIPTNGADIGEFTPKFLWKPYIPLHDVTVLSAPGGTGKTFASNWLAAQVSRGGYIKGDTDYYAQGEARHTGKYPEAGNIAYISAEEEEELIKDRFVKSGGDPARLFVFDKYKSVDMNFTDGYLPFLISVQSCHPRLIIIDPLQAYVGKDVDLNRKNQMRPAMQRLAIIAKKCNSAIVLIAHSNKSKQLNNINNSVSGSTDIVDASRSVLMVVRDPDDEDARVLVHTKANYAALGDSLKFHITLDGGFVYDGISQITRDVIETADRNRKTIAEVMTQQRDERSAKSLLIEAIKRSAIPGQTVRVAYEEMIDLFGEEVFGYAKRPGAMLQKVMPALKEAGIGIETKTINGTPISKTYNGKHANGFDIYQDAPKDK